MNNEDKRQLDRFNEKVRDFRRGYKDNYSHRLDRDFNEQIRDSRRGIKR